MPILIFNYLFFVTVLSHNLASCETTYDEEPRRTFPFRRAIDGTRGSKYYEPEDDGFSQNYGSSGRYDPDNQDDDFSDIRNNVPGEPGIDYPSYTRLPQTGFICEPGFRGYYADEVAGCQVFHVCDGTFLVSSFLCPVGSVFSQKLLTCDWWTKVDCSSTRNYHVINSESLVSEVDDDEILRKAFEMAHSAAERIPAETINQEHLDDHDREHRIVGTATDRYNDLPTDTYSDYPDYQGAVKSRFPSRTGQKSRQRYSNDDYNVRDVDEDAKESPIRVHTIGEDRRNDRNYRKNDFQPSYAPTVPTVSTTARRYYSPTFPTTTFRPPTERNNNHQHRGRFDLEVESSDHLYKARGRSEHTIKAATSSSVFAPKIASDPNIATLVNSASINAIPETEANTQDSSQYKTTIALPFVENHTESTVGKDVTETLSVMTIDNEKPDKFEYNHETERKTKISNEENEDFVGTSDFDTNDRRHKIIAFLAPPQEDPPKFRITVLEDANKSRQRAPKLEEIPDDKRSKSIVEVLRHVEPPSVYFTPPLLSGNDASKDSRVIRIKINEEPRQNASVVSNDVVSYGNDYGALIEDSVGEHSETKISEILPNNGEEMKNLTNDDATSFALDSHSIGVINAAVVALQQSADSNAEDKTDSSSSSELDDEEQITGNFEKSIDILANIGASISERQNGRVTGKSKEMMTTTKATIPDKQNGEDAEKFEGRTTTTSTKATIPAEQKGEDAKRSEEITTTTKPMIMENQKGKSAEKSEESLLNTQSLIVDKQIGGNDEKSGEILLTSGETTAEEHNSRNAHKSDELLLVTGKKEIDEKQNGEKIVTEISESKNAMNSQKSTETYSSSERQKDKNIEFSNDSAILSSPKTLAEKMTNENRSISSPESVSNRNTSDSVDNEEKVAHLERRNLESIDSIADKPETLDSIAAADYKSFAIVKPNEPNGPRGDSRSPRRIYSRDEEDVTKFRSNNLQSRDYYRSIVALINGSNLPRPFSLENPQNVKIQTPSDSSRTSFTSGSSGIEVKAADRNPVEPPLPKDSKKLSSSSSLELSDEKVLEQLNQDFGKRQLKEDKIKLEFELPKERRFFDFISGRTLEDHRENESNDEKTNERLKKNSQISNKKETTVVETELIPSISFALNTEEEREEYMEAVMKGLLTDFRGSATSNNDTISGLDS